ncbi:hypothetical protein [Kineothrix sp. MB12-C1]|uniref:hypothetical protein n=1 Tax=Kineothrix sp. MB12-C1 TaxID=3070215 RepID=UPI0027D270BB|nr:hypothetical protein [Kineothrix sp. MB12-C1]WMC92913.1 hypothetical protein RBB56_01085 [Kineothrix sp. MB12-C1]
MERPGQEANGSGRFDNGIFSGPQGGRRNEDNRYWSAPGGNTDIPVRPYAPQPQPYRRNVNIPYEHRCAGCPYQKNSDHIALIIVAVASVVVLLIAFLATIFCLISVVAWSDRQRQQTYGGYENEVVPPSAQIPYVKPEPDANVPEGNNSKDYYAEVEDAIRADLTYSIEWDNYEYEGNSDLVMITVDYPVIVGEVPNKDILNRVIAEETEYFEEYFEEYSKYMMEDEVFAVYAEGYVTYMDEAVMSVVFHEEIYTDYWQDHGLYCINIDMENGVVLNNNSILDLNSEFVSIFRKKSQNQNGDVGLLNKMSDQEVIDYLSNINTSIIFYTPLGMEIGMNFGEGYLTVTYKDYEMYMQRY